MFSAIDTSYKTHILIAALVSLWLVLFLVLIAPFDIAELPFMIRLQLMPIYGLLSFVAYLLLVPLQKFLYRQLAGWPLWTEVLLIFLFQALTLGFSFWYYQSGWINGNYSFSQFTLEVYYPIFFVLLTILIALRWFFFRKKTLPTSAKVVVQGDNKRDILQLPLADLICISSADNYVEVTYLQDGTVHKKLVRATLKSTATAHPELLRVHRSVLINPMHFIAWSDPTTLRLTHTEVPVSKSYRAALLAADSPLRR